MNIDASEGTEGSADDPSTAPPEEEIVVETDPETTTTASPTEKRKEASKGNAALLETEKSSKSPFKLIHNKFKDKKTHKHKDEKKEDKSDENEEDVDKIIFKIARRESSIKRSTSMSSLKITLDKVNLFFIMSILVFAIP